MGSSNSAFKLALVYQNGKGDKNTKIEIDLEKSAHYYFKTFQLRNNEALKIKIINFIQKNKINWKKEYHLFWKAEKKLGKRILMLLLISKYRKQSNNHLVSSIMVKGITAEIIKFSLQFSTNNFKLKF